ncbi:FISUMP domain-containing protein [Labilibaculum euxinus]|uniref:Fibrobacter succinogenes major paralogous domain-containing protein n=1 Tax=Labilibaculum euxinus TaxID=2686357 RepID=A0A7M4D978_9BACT|nr:FISUMP domain-containing protein [Labilibaculum euxinus]MUP39207.1 hypothetical protein [Labilibaculum euxinus]MVB08412.1 hypothetical protein [Labilibaculum euxinus]
MKRKLNYLLFGLLLSLIGTVQSCDKSDDPTIPTVVAKDVIDIKETSATLVFNFESGGGEIIDCGVCYGKNPDPTVKDSVVIYDYFRPDGYENLYENDHVMIMNKLEDGVKYYVRAYAKNEVGLAYGNQVEFTTIASKLPKLAAELLEYDSRTATCKVNVTYDGGCNITEHGVVIGKDRFVDTKKYLQKEVMGEGKGEFTITLNGLRWETDYHLKAYAINENGTTYTEDVEFTTPTIYGSFTDERDGNVYRTLKIGSQTWMADNLKYLPKVYSAKEGNPLQAYTYVIDYNGTDVAAAKENWYYKNAGVLYNLVAAQLSCPEGWHLPTDEEWIEMELALGMDKSEAELSSRTTLDVVKMTDNRDNMWLDMPNDANEYGLSMIDYGKRAVSESGVGHFLHIWGSGYWTNTQNNSSNYIIRDFDISNRSVNMKRLSSSKEYGLFVRCVKDE